MAEKGFPSLSTRPVPATCLMKELERLFKPGTQNMVTVDDGSRKSSNHSRRIVDRLLARASLLSDFKRPECKHLRHAAGTSATTMHSRSWRIVYFVIGTTCGRVLSRGNADGDARAGLLCRPLLLRRRQFTAAPEA